MRYPAQSPISRRLRQAVFKKTLPILTQTSKSANGMSKVLRACQRQITDLGILPGESKDILHSSGLCTLSGNEMLVSNLAPP